MAGSLQRMAPSPAELYAPVHKYWISVSSSRLQNPRANPAGALAYRMELNGHLRDDTLFVYDLELPASVPQRVRELELLSAIEQAISDAAELRSASRQSAPGSPTQKPP